MTDIPKPQGDVLRRNAERECGTPIGQVNIFIRNREGAGGGHIETVSFYCNKPRLHLDECEFIATQVRVRSTGQSVSAIGSAKR